MELKKTLGEWHTPMQQLLSSKMFEQIGKKLMELHQDGRSILPSFEHIFRPFAECQPQDLKAVILSPYPYDIKGYADGLAMSTKMEVAPSWLRHIQRAWEKDFLDGFGLEVYKSSPDLSYLARQGVLLLNAAFTCEPSEPMAHSKLWQPFTSAVLQMISYYFRDIVFILIGGHTMDFISCIEEPKHIILNCSHPASADYFSSSWEHCSVFKRCNRVLEAKGKAPVSWYIPVTEPAIA